MPTIPFADARWLQTIATCVFLAAYGPPAVQAVESADTVNRIVGSDVRQEETRTATQTKKIISAIERTRENIGTVRKTSKLDSVDIVFLTDAARSEGGPPPAVENKVKEHQDDITELREEIEANALLFNAIDSRRVLAQDVLAVEFDDPGRLVIYAAAKPPS
ncbi:hypothetical protein FJV76_27150 [Mesorhizobium sp. WSM4303]|uniref:hypothetical protein n=1 Tax=unclassified Mesorhizobium TaxID=325217 RepID=UPI00115C6467|nr:MULTISPECIES: hypothetical protein [unclassified Mesorhizobium]TRC95194.1 hypothetical protein FJV77_17300 [Mesorhizobium sp. WSM4306]TRC97745.1 hypothetical protein FJV76_27150 [Mesorhizobium sp. WSM4303]